MVQSLRLCLDLNIWCAALLSELKGRQGTSSQRLVELVGSGSCTLGSVQLVISWGMLNHLRLVLEQRLNIPQEIASFYITTIRGYAEMNAIGAGPQLTLGGTGVVALQDREDAHVLETAIAGRASVLVRRNFDDFISKDTQLVVPHQHAIHVTPMHSFHIAQPQLLMGWLRSGELPFLGVAE